QTATASDPEPPSGTSVTLSGTSASQQRAPRELDLTLDGDEIQLHIHAPGGRQPKSWVSRSELQRAFDAWDRPRGGPGRVEVPGRTNRKEQAAVFLFDESDEVEVQAGWWVWVKKDELRAAFKGLGVVVPW